MRIIYEQFYLDCKGIKKVILCAAKLAAAICCCVKDFMQVSLENSAYMVSQQRIS
jgi:hypothetical protein